MMKARARRTATGARRLPQTGQNTGPAAGTAPRRPPASASPEKDDMRPEAMHPSAAAASGAIPRDRGMAIGRHLPPPHAARLPERGRHTGSRSGLLAPSREMEERGERLRRRVHATPPCAHPDAECFLPNLPEILAGLFASVIVTFAHGALRSYALRAEALASRSTSAARGTGTPRTASPRAAAWSP
jgi:hypothetical protein